MQYGMTGADDDATVREVVGKLWGDDGKWYGDRGDVMGRRRGTSRVMTAVIIFFSKFVCLSVVFD